MSRRREHCADSISKATRSCFLKMVSAGFCYAEQENNKAKTKHYESHGDSQID